MACRASPKRSWARPFRGREVLDVREYFFVHGTQRNVMEASCDEFTLVA